MIVRPSTATRNAMLAAIGGLADGGTIEIYQGAQPARSDEKIGSEQTLLVRLALSSPAFGAPINGVMGARDIGERPALASGRASWARIADRAGRPIVDINVGVMGAALNLPSTQLFERGPVAIYALVLRMQMPAA